MKQGSTFCLLMFCSILSHAQVEQILAIDSSNIETIRNELADSVYGDEVVPEFQLITNKDSARSMLEETFPPDNMKSMEVGIVNLKHGFTSKIYIMHPVQDNGLNVPIIYHSGHGLGVFREDVQYNFANDTVVGKLTLGFFLSKGFTIIGIDMPFVAENTWPPEIEVNNYVHPMYGHDDLFYLKDPFYYFLAPVKSVIDYLQAKMNWNEYVMYGLSGGGWSTTLYSALDTRIRLSFPVAGSIPVPLRTEARDLGDLEQYYPPFYNRFNYSTLYFLGAAGVKRKQYQILIKKDNCCFAFDGHVLWENDIKNALKDRGMPGSFDFFYDTVSNTHRISAVSVDSMDYHIIHDMVDEKMEETFLLTSSRESNKICDNDTIQLYLPQVGVNQIEWYRNGQKIDTAVSYSLKVGQEGNYNAVVRNISGGVIATAAIAVQKQNIFSTPIISRSGDKLYSSYASGNSWYLNGQRIKGSDGNSLPLSKPGRYTLRVSESTCVSDFSEPYDFGVSVFPNPSSFSLTVRLPRDLQTVFYSLRTMQGAEVLRGSFVGETVLHYTIKPGVYLLVLKNRSGFNSVRKIVVSN